jgi:hypothetical protein
MSIKASRFLQSFPSKSQPFIPEVVVIANSYGKDIMKKDKGRNGEWISPPLVRKTVGKWS